jgi:hypothetical protein
MPLFMKPSGRTNSLDKYTHERFRFFSEIGESVIDGHTFNGF